MVVPLSKFVNVNISIASEGVVTKDFRTPVFISDKVQFKTAGRTFESFSSASELAAQITYDGAEVTDSSEVYKVALALTASGLDKFIIADVSTTPSTSDGSTPTQEIATSLDTLKLSTQFFYIIAAYRAPADVLSIARWAESNEVMYFTSTNDDLMKSNSYTPEDTSIGGQLLRAGYNNTVCLYSSDMNNFPEARWIGAKAIETPGDSIWAYADLTGISPDNLTSGEYDNIISRNANAFISTSGKRLTSPGKVSSGEWIDKIIEKFYIKSRVQEEVFDLITSQKKIPFNDAGIGIIASRFDQTLDRLTRNIIDQYQIRTPTLSQLSPTEINSRKVSISARVRLKGAIQSANFDIVLSVGDILNG